MKQVHRLSAEPPGLAAYRTHNPAEELKPPTEAKEVWNRFRADPGYMGLLQALIGAQQGLCLYCEQRLVHPDGNLVFADYQVEHVLPKSGGTGRTLDWQNLAAACGGGTYAHHKDASRQHTGKDSESCGQRKGDRPLDAGCDPRTFPLTPRFVEVGQDGRMKPNVPACSVHGVVEADLDTTINDVLNLNGERLRFKRQGVFDNVRAWLVELLIELMNNTHLTEVQRNQFLSLMIAGRLQPDANGHLRAFWTTERCALDAPGDAWVAQNQTLFT